MTFTVDDVALVSNPLATVTIKGQGFLLDPESFYDLEHYKKMVGYDKEFDFRPEDSEKVEDRKTELKRPEVPPLKPHGDTQPADDDSLPINLRKKRK